MELRGYQQAAVSSVWDYIRAKNDNPCVVIPTGGGKSPVIAQLCKDAVAWGGRVMIVTHVKELVEQNYKHIDTLLPGMRIGVYSAGLGSRDTDAQVTVGGIQSIYKRPEEFGKVDLIIVDEAHRIPADGEGMYQTYLKACQAVNPSVRLIGMTATPYRTGSGQLCNPDSLLNQVCYEIGVRELIRDGWLSPLSSKSCREKIDVSKVTVRAGEFVTDELQAAVSDVDKVAMACIELGERTYSDRKSVLVSSCGVEHAKLVASIMKDVGETRLVLGDTPSDERAKTIKDFREGHVRYLVNVDVLTTGFDAPGVDCVAVMRPTMSPGLWVQMCGRGSRLSPNTGKKDCLILDFGGNALRHGPIDHINMQTRKLLMSEGKAPFKECPECQETLPAGSGTCPACGHTFERDMARHSKSAHASDAMTGEEVFDVFDVHYFKHYKKGDLGAKPTLRVNYDIGTLYGPSEWICFEHTGFARAKAAAWWRARSDQPMPGSVDAALVLSNTLKTPKRIAIRMEGKYTRVTRHEELSAPEKKQEQVDEVPF